MTIFAVLSITCLSIAVLTMVGWAFLSPRPVALIAEDTTEDPDPEEATVAVVAAPKPKWPYEGRHRLPERLPDLTDTDVYDEAVAEDRERSHALRLAAEDRTFLEAVAAQPVVRGADPFADPAPRHPDPCGYPDVVPCICPATPADWFGVPNDDTRQLTAVQ